MMLAPQNTAGPAGARGRGIHLGIFSTVVSTLLIAGAAQAQTGSSVVQGGVVDAVTRKPVGEAIVTVTSPSLQGEQTVLTDSSGYYRAPTLPAGVYTLRVDKDGYDSFEQKNVNVRGEVTLRMNVFLIPRKVEGKAEEIEITERAPVIDVGSSSVSTTFSEDMIKRLPLSRPDVARGGGVRSYEAVAAAAPQARGDAYGTSISGSTSPENRFSINGLSVNDSAYGINTTPLSVDFLKEVRVDTGGYLPEFGRALGGIVNATVKSGSNEIRGSAWTNVTPGVLEGTPLALPGRSRLDHPPRPAPRALCHPGRRRRHADQRSGHRRLPAHVDPGHQEDLSGSGQLAAGGGEPQLLALAQPFVHVDLVRDPLARGRQRQIRL
jgi:hypothetical protein